MTIPVDRAISSQPGNAGGDADPEHAKVREAAEKFEGFFIGQLLREMRRSTRELSSEDSVYRSSVDSDMLDMADVALGNSLASQHAFGIADAILRQMLPASEDTAPAVAAADSLKETARAVAKTDGTSVPGTRP